MHFVHEKKNENNPDDGDFETVSFDGTEIPIADFLKMEPDYPVLPADVRGINYIPDGAHYSIDLNGNVIEAHISTEILDGFLAKVETYKTYIVKNEAAAEAVALAALPYDRRRQMEYPPKTDYLDGVVKGDQTQIDKYIADCLAVKVKYPKP